MFPVNLSLKWLIPMLVFTLGLIAVCAIWILREWGQPEWKQHQRAEYAEMRKDLQKQLKILEDPTWGDPKKAKIVKKTVEYLEKPSLQIKQILLKGTGLWKEGTSGVRVDRCMTCHINEDKLSKTHQRTVEQFPFDIYGCTVCHKGNGRALRSELAHEGMFRNKRDMEERLNRPEDILHLWEEFAELSLQEKIRSSDFKYFHVTGEKQIYVGSITCLRCHKKLTAFHVNEWIGSKFITFEKVKQSKDYIEGDENYRKQCLKCHTTGYNEKNGEYAEESVTCEACHGPGEIYAQFMSTGKIAEAATLSEHSFDFKVCGDCHIPRRHEMRQAMLLARETKEQVIPEADEPSTFKEVVGELDILLKVEDSQKVVGTEPHVYSPGALSPGLRHNDEAVTNPYAQLSGQESLDSLALTSKQLAEMDEYRGRRDSPAQTLKQVQGTGLFAKQMGESASLYGGPQAQSLDLSQSQDRSRQGGLAFGEPKGLSLQRIEGPKRPLKAKLKAFKGLDNKGAKEARLKERGSPG